MLFMEHYTRNLNLNICPETYNKIEKVATERGMKTGSMARRILQEWAKAKNEQPKKGERFMED